MDKKDYNEQDPLDMKENTEENNTSGEETQAPLVEDTSPVIDVRNTSEIPADTEINESVPVMSKADRGPAGIADSAPKNNKGWMIASLILAAVLIIVLIKPPFQKSDGDTAVATVNGADITKDQLYEKLVEAGGENTLSSLITTTLVEQEAKKANVGAVTDADINLEIEELQNQFGGEAALNSALDQSGMTLDDLKKQMPIQVQLRKILEPQITVTDEEIKTYYEDNKAAFDTEEQVRASHILVETKEEADAIVGQLKAGEDFAKLAQEKSADTGSKGNGGDLDFFTRGDMVAEFSDAAFKLKVGETSGAVQSQYGYHIIKVTDRKEAQISTLEDKKDEVRKTLVSQKISEKSATWMEETRANAKITNTLTDAKAETSATEAPAAK